MQSKTVTVPNISCGHCTHTVEMELNDIAGVSSVKADIDSKQVVVEGGDPATWAQIVHVGRDQLSACGLIHRTFCWPDRCQTTCQAF